MWNVTTLAMLNSDGTVSRSSDIRLKDNIILVED